MDNVLPAGKNFLLGDDLSVSRLGFGAMRIMAQLAWGQPADRPAMFALLRRVAELSVNPMFGPWPNL